MALASSPILQLIIIVTKKVNKKEQGKFFNFTINKNYSKKK